MATVLVSFIGTGNHVGNVGEDASKAGYEPVSYNFDNGLQVKTTIFGSALHKYLISKDTKETVDSWLIMGTPQSIWCDLIQMFDEPIAEILKAENIKKQYEYLKTQARKDVGNNGKLQSQIRQEHLEDWQKVLTDKLGLTKVICKEVGDATKQESQNKIFESLLDVIKYEDKIVFDVTHGLRNQPIITSFVIMYLRYLKNITDVEFYYGAKDLDGKVIKLDFCNELLKATEAVAIFEQTGNYEQIGKQVNLDADFNTKIKKITFADEMHRASSELPNDLKNKLEKTTFDKPIEESLSGRLIKALDWSDDLSFAKRLCNKAVSNKNKRQYFKAIASLYEAIAIASCLVVKEREINITLDTSKYNDRDYALNDKKSGIPTKLDASENGKLSSLKSLRNAILHGTDTNATQIANAIDDEEKFIKIFQGGETVFDTIIKKI
jgi:cell division protein DivIC